MKSVAAGSYIIVFNPHAQLTPCAPCTPSTERALEPRRPCSRDGGGGQSASTRKRRRRRGSAKRGCRRNARTRPGVGLRLPCSIPPPVCRQRTTSGSGDRRATGRHSTSIGRSCRSLMPLTFFCAAVHTVDGTRGSCAPVRVGKGRGGRQRCAGAATPKVPQATESTEPSQSSGERARRCGRCGRQRRRGRSRSRSRRGRPRRGGA